MTPRAATRAAAHSATTTATAIRRAALALLLAAILLAGGMLGGPRPSSADGTLTADSVAITSTPSAAMDYHAGETITATVTFSQAVTAHTSASLIIAIGTNNRTVTLDDATSLNSTTLDFSYIVTSADADSNGVAVAANAISGTYEHAGHSTGSHSITSITTALSDDSDHKVNSTDTIDYDTDDDGLIEVDSLAKLDAIRYNLSGNGNPTGADAAAHNDAFPRPMDYHGCDADGDGTLAACTGYELTANLDFDYNDNGSTHTGGVIDSGDAVAATAAYFDSTTGWNPIGGHANTGGTFSGAFEGNNHTIANLYINLNTSSNDDGRNVGLFGKTSGALRNLGLVNPYLKNTRSGGGTLIYSGALSGISSGAVSRSYVDGGQVTGGQSAGAINIDSGGCLLGRSSGTVSDSYATCNVTAATGDYGSAGGLIGHTQGTVRRSYATGTVTSDYRAGGLIGTAGSSSISDSYATGAVSVSTNNSHAGGLVGWANTATSVTNSYATGNVSADSSSNAGGLVGDFAANNVRAIGSYATGNVSATGNSNNLGGLVGHLRENGNVIGSYATGNVSTAGNSSNLGGLAGRTQHGATSIRASYATGSVSTTGDNNNLGGLVGHVVPTTFQIRASYATSAVSSNGGSTNDLGGLVGHMQIQTAWPSVVASYAVGAVSATGGSNNDLGGLVGGTSVITGQQVTRTVFTNTYWDNTAAGTGQSSSATRAAGGSGQLTTALQSPDEYGTTGLYAAWNIDVDETGNANDDPWHFGGSTDYPILKFGHDAPSIARQTNAQYAPAEYDGDNDNLIDITTLAQLNAIRYDLDGDGRSATGDDALAYAAAFPGATKSMGCPATCIGYELMDDLDFDYDEDGSTHTSGTIDSDDAVAATAAYFNSATGWTPIGGHTSSAAPYTAIFEGNGNTIDNLYINLTTTSATDSVYVGLFADIGKPATTSPAAPAVPGVVRNVGLVDPYVSNARSSSGSSGFTTVRTGALAGRNSDAGTVSGSYVSGGSVTGSQSAATNTVYNLAGCLLGQNNGTVAASNAGCAASATGAAAVSDYAGGLMGWNQGAVSSSYATGTATADARAGGLVGELTAGGTVIASYATGAASVTGDGGLAGGLVGSMSSASTAVRASYATGAVSTSGGGTNNLGGLAGQISGTAPVIAASYSTGTVTASGTGVGVTNNRGGLVGALVGSPVATASQVTNSYWDETTTGIAGTGTGVRKTTAQLIAPTAYGSTATDIYMNWNLNLDGETGGDDPWHFGTNAQYPLLKYGHDAASVALQIVRQAGADLVDYDADNDNLIEISALAQLDAIRYDLDGNGLGVVGDDAVAYAAAFPGLPKGMGCPAVCQGYELVTDLDFDTDGDGQTYTISGGAVTVDAGDTDNFFDSAEGWIPIGNNTTGYSGVFEGNRHVIDNLFINVPSGSANDVARERVGLFAKVDRGGVIRGVSLTDVYMNRERTGTGIVYAGALVGQSFGTVTASSATGEVRAIDAYASSSSQVGGLVGESGNRSAVNASWADVAVTVDGPMVRAGGLVGTSLGGKIVASHAFGDVNVDDSPNGRVGGLVGSLNLLGATTATVTASYARGEVAGSGTSTTGRVLGGLVGGGSSASGVTDSYWDNSTSGTNQASSYGGGEGKTTAELQSITGYTGIYANWNVDVDGAMGNDDPWHFGANDQYPTLKYGGFSPAAQGSAGADYDTDSDGLIEITTLAQLDAIRLDLDGDGRPTSVLAYRAAFPVGDVGSDAEMGTAGRMGCSHSDPVVRTCLGYELMSDLDFDTDGSGSANAADDYWNGGAGWTPLGGHSGTPRPFVATFDGNGNTISNLYINLSTDGADAATFVGLFADIGIPGNPTASPAVPAVPGVVRNVTLAEPSVNNVRSGGAATGSTWVRTGALAGRSNAGSVVRGSAVTGGSVTGRQGVVAGNAFNLVGCLLGYNAGTVRDSSASCAATATGANAPPTGIDRAGGLVGQNANEAGGPGLIRDSSATGVVSGDSVAGGLVGQNGINGQVTGSSATGAVSASDAEGKAGGLVGILNGGADVRDSSATGASAVAGSGPNSFVGGLVGQIDSTGTTVTDSYATRAVSASGAGSFASGGLGNLAGGLAGVITGGAIVSASYATGNVSTTAANSKLGGLAGRVDTTATLVRATYATGTVTTSGGGTNTLGGLVGELAGAPDGANPHLIHSSYATGRVSASGGGTNALGGLVGAAVGGAVTSQVAFSYYDNTTAGTGRSTSPGGGMGQTTAALQGPTEYGSGIYVNWNLNLDEQAGGDDPWHFGGSSQYPVLQHSRGPLDIARQLTPVPTPADYDLDNDNLIDVGNLAQLNAIRHDLNGDGAGLTGAGAAGYLSAYPGYQTGMGCPGTCAGYELRANLDFDTNGDGMVNASDEIADFRAIGGTYSATFQGNGHTISNMHITNTQQGHKGLFAELTGRISAVGLIEPVLSGGLNPSVGYWRFGALVGINKGTINASWVRGGSITTMGEGSVAGGLVGQNGVSPSERGTVRASYSTARVSNSNGEATNAGGLVGSNVRGTIVASYAAGAVQGGGTDAEFGCLAVNTGTGFTPITGTITNSYWDTDVCTRTGGGGASHSAADLQLAGYTGIYANWNLNVDGDADTGDDQGRDDPWDFRVGHYPALKYGSAADLDIQRPLLAEAGAAVEAYSGQTVTLDGSGSRAPSGAAYRWTRMPTEATPAVTINGATTPAPTFLAPTGLTSDTTMTFRLTLTAGGRSVYDEVTVSIVAVRPNQLLSLTLTDSEGDAVGLAPPFVSLTYDYRASVANQIASVTVTPGLLAGSTMTLNGQAVSSGAEVEVPLKYRGNQITIVVTPPEPEPDETMDGETTDGETPDETAAETPCSVENNGEKPCTYTVTVNRAVPPRLAFVPRSLTIDEGGTATYTVELDTRILTGAVTVAIASDNPAVTVSPTEVTLRPLDMAPRTITVTAASDADRNNETATITHTANGAHYYDVIATVGVTVNDTTAPPPAPDPALSVSTTALRLTEGGSGSYTVALATRPDDNVIVTIASDNPDVTTRPASLTFTTANWSTPQRVTVSAASDGDTANDAATLTHTASGGGYGDAPAVSVTVSVTDDDTPGLSITPTVLNLIENGISAYIVSLTAQPSGNVTVSIASDNPDVTVRPTALTFTPTNWDTPQAVLVITRADAGGGDELATLRMTAQGGGYAGQTGQVLASVDDTLAPLPAGSITTTPDAPAGVSVYAPPGSAATATVSAPADDTPTVATGAGFGIGPAVAVSVSDAPDDGLEICLPVSDALRAEAGSALVLTLLRYAAGSWTELAGARDLGDRVCAAGATGQAAYAAAYALPPGTVLDLAASVGDDPGTVVLSWTPPAAGASQVAVVVNIADDTDYCLDTLPGLDASTYTCADRTAGATYVALLIVLLPDGGYTLANIVRFDLPAAGSQ